MSSRMHSMCTSTSHGKLECETTEPNAALGVRTRQTTAGGYSEVGIETI